MFLRFLLLATLCFSSCLASIDSISYPITSVHRTKHSHDSSSKTYPIALFFIILGGTVIVIASVVGLVRYIQTPKPNRIDGVICRFWLQASKEPFDQIPPPAYFPRPPRYSVNDWCPSMFDSPVERPVRSHTRLRSPEDLLPLYQP
ncbi:hypothetical protein GYMLUDRAFT_36589 [Collybiopsis luxurians FD-317 M1]|nr:hypothetical protein GYMLUDRAFT_36589 [Collybiopsis luxurians FD-317 M1]